MTYDFFLEIDFFKGVFKTLVTTLFLKVIPYNIYIHLIFRSLAMYVNYIF